MLVSVSRSWSPKIVSNIYMKS